MSQVKLEWARRNVADKMIKAQFIIQQMTTNVAEYPTPLPALADIQTALEDLIQATVNAEAGGLALTLAKNNAEQHLDDLIRQLMAYVENVSNGDAATILLSGMDVRKAPEPTPPPTQVQNLSARPSLFQGTIDLRWDTLGARSFYQVERLMGTDDDAQWVKLAVSSKSKFQVTGLSTGTVYRFRVAGIGKDDSVGPYSQEATSVAP